MSGVNKVILIGNLGADPEVRHLEGGTAVANFNIATSETFKDKNTGEKRTNTEWHRIVLWRGLAEIAEKYLKKGSKVYIEGRLRTRSWDDQSGQTRYTTEIQGDNLTMLDRRDDNQQSGVDPEPMRASSPRPTAAATAGADDMDDLPF